MSNDLLLLVLGWLLGLASSLVTVLLAYWLEGKREIRREAANQRRADIRAARNWSASGRVESMKGFDLSGANLSGVNLKGADLEDANFTGAQMWNTNLASTKLIRANFTSAVIRGANFRGANLHLASFDGALVKEANFSEAQLRRTKLSKVKLLEDCVWTSTNIDDTTEIRPEHLAQVRGQTGIPSV